MTQIIHRVGSLCQSFLRFPTNLLHWPMALEHRQMRARGRREVGSRFGRGWSLICTGTSTAPLLPTGIGEWHAPHGTVSEAMPFSELRPAGGRLRATFRPIPTSSRAFIPAGGLGVPTLTQWHGTPRALLSGPIGRSRGSQEEEGRSGLSSSSRHPAW